MDRCRITLVVVFGWLATFALLFGPLAEKADAAGVALSRKYYENKQHGFKFCCLRDWPGYPPKPGDDTTIVHFRSDKAYKGYGFTPKCRVAHLTPDGNKTLKDYLDDRLAVTFKLERGRFLPSHKLPPGSSQYKLQLTGQGETALGYAVEYKREDDAIGIVYYCASQEFDKHYRKVFIYSLASFKFTKEASGSDASEGGSLDSLEKGKETAIERRAREIREKGFPPGWNIFPIPNYIIYYNCDLKDLYAVADRLKRIRPQYYKYFPPLNEDTVENAAPIVRLCATHRDFASYSGVGNPGVLGYWSPGVEELVVYRKSQYFGTMKKLFFDVLQHEGFHQYIYYACEHVSPCITFNEGPAEFFASFQPKGGAMVPTLENQTRAGTIKSCVNTDGHVPISEIIWYDQPTYYADSSTCYAEGWALTTFLQLGDRVMGGQFKPEWGEIMPKYFRVLQDEVRKASEETEVEIEIDEENDRMTVGLLGSQARRKKILKKAMEEAIKGIDLDALEEIWKIFVVKKL